MAYMKPRLYWATGLSAILVLPVLAPTLSAFGGKADSLEHLSECLLIARSGHSGIQTMN